MKSPPEIQPTDPRIAFPSHSDLDITLQHPDLSRDPLDLLNDTSLDQDVNKAQAKLEHLFKRGCTHKFLNLEVEGMYMDEHRTQLLYAFQALFFFQALIGAMRIAVFLPSFYGSLDGEYDGPIVLSGITFGLVAVIMGVGAVLERYCSDAMWWSSSSILALIAALSFNHAHWDYWFFFSDAEMYTKVMVQESLLDNGCPHNTDINDALGGEMKHQLSTTLLTMNFGFGIIAMLGFSFRLAVAVQCSFSVVQLAFMYAAPYVVYIKGVFYIGVCNFCIWHITFWYDGHCRQNWAQTTLKHRLFVYQMRIRDLEEQKHLQAQQEMEKRHEQETAAQAVEQAQARSKIYGQLVSGTAHDLRTPVSAIQSGCRVLCMQYKEKNLKEMDRTLNWILATVETSIKLLDCMLVSSRLLEGVGLKITYEKCNIRKMVHRSMACCQLASGMLPGLEVSYSVPRHIAHEVITDPQCLMRLLNNLLNNACQHTVQGMVSLAVSIAYKDNKSWLEFAVMDTGTGHIPSPTLWEPFISDNPVELQHRIQGTGMGLFVVSRVSETLGGTCGSYLNPNGPGSVFWFRVPYKPVEQDGNSPSNVLVSTTDLLADQQQVDSCRLEDQPVTVAQPGSHEEEGIETDYLTSQLRVRAPVETHESTPHLLLIDDVLALLRLQAEELKGYGLQVTQAHGPVEGLEALKKREYTLVLCDFRMTGMDGPELTRRFREWERKNRTSVQRISALTAYSSREIHDLCIDAGMDGWLTKPVDYKALFDLITPPGRQDGVSMESSSNGEVHLAMKPDSFDLSQSSRCCSGELNVTQTSTRSSKSGVSTQQYESEMELMELPPLLPFNYPILDAGSPSSEHENIDNIAQQH